MNTLQLLKNTAAAAAAAMLATLHLLYFLLKKTWNPPALYIAPTHISRTNSPL
jgi:hypothetical protein